MGSLIDKTIVSMLLVGMKRINTVVSDKSTNSQNASWRGWELAKMALLMRLYSNREKQWQTRIISKLYFHMHYLKVNDWLEMISFINKTMETPHTHKKSQVLCERNFPRIIKYEKWPVNSPDLNVLDYFVWDASGNNIQWKMVHNYDTLIKEIKKGIANVS